MFILNRVKMEENENTELKNPFTFTRNVSILTFHTNKHHNPGTIGIIPIFRQNWRSGQPDLLAPLLCL